MRYLQAPALRPKMIPKMTKPATVLTPVKAKMRMAQTAVHTTVSQVTLIYLARTPTESRPMKLAPLTMTNYYRSELMQVHLIVKR